MPGPIHITKRTRNLVIAVLAAAYLGVCAFGLLSTRGWINRPFPGFLPGRNLLVPIINLSHWEGRQKGIRTKFIIAAVNDQRISSDRELYRIVAEHKPGDELFYTVDQRWGGRMKVPVKIAVFTLQDYLLIFPGIMLVGAALVAMGLLVFYLKPNLPASWALMAFCLLMGFTQAAAGEFTLNHRLFYPAFTYPLVGPSLLVLSLYFPVEIKRKKPFLWLILLSTPAVIFINVYLAKDPYLYRNAAISLIVHVHLLRLLGIGIMLRSFYLSREPRVRQQGKVVVFGFLVVFALVIAINVASIFFEKGNLAWTVLPWVIFALAIFYAITKHNLFDADVFIRRSVSYLLVSGVAVALFFGLVTSLSLFLQGFTGQSSQIAAVLSTLAMVMVFRPLQVRIDRGLDRRFFREKYEYTATLRKASQLLISIIDLNLLLRKLLDTVLDAIQIERGLILLGQDAGEFRAVVSGGYPVPEERKALDPESPWLRKLRAGRKALALNDVMELEEFREDRAVLIGLMKEMRVVLLIPFFYEQRLIGVLGLGEKKSGAWYSSEDIELLQTLMLQTAVSIENARKVEALKKMVELETSYRELKRLDELKDNFLSMVSHDLRTPMTSIKGYASILVEKLHRLDPDRQKRYLEIIIKESDRLTRLINNLLDLQRFEAGKMQMALLPVDLVKIAREALDSFQGAALANKQDLESDLPETAVMVQGDADRLSQVLSNFLSNATKFTPEGGRIRLVMAAAQEDGKPAVRVAVQDNGPGIPREKQEQLFSKFQQVDTLVKDKQAGSGLGLALVREIIERHGGRVGLESQAGQGATFYFILPAWF